MPSTSATCLCMASSEAAIQREARSVANGKAELQPLDFLLSPEEISATPTPAGGCWGRGRAGYRRPAGMGNRRIPLVAWR